VPAETLAARAATAASAAAKAAMGVQAATREVA